MVRRSAAVLGVVMLAVGTMASAGCTSSAQLAISTTSPTSQSECGRTPGTAGTWRPELGYCEY